MVKTPTSQRSLMQSTPVLRTSGTQRTWALYKKVSSVLGSDSKTARQALDAYWLERQRAEEAAANDPSLAAAAEKSVRRVQLALSAVRKQPQVMHYPMTPAIEQAHDEFDAARRFPESTWHVQARMVLIEAHREAAHQTFGDNKYVAGRTINELVAESMRAIANFRNAEKQKRAGSKSLAKAKAKARVKAHPYSRSKAEAKSSGPEGPIRGVGSTTEDAKDEETVEDMLAAIEDAIASMTIESATEESQNSEMTTVAADDEDPKAEDGYSTDEDAGPSRPPTPEADEDFDPLAYAKKHNITPIRRQRAFCGALPDKITYLPDDMTYINGYTTYYD